MLEIIVFFDTLMGGKWYGKMSFIDAPREEDIFQLEGLRFKFKKEREHIFHVCSNESREIFAQADLIHDKGLPTVQEINHVMTQRGFKVMIEVDIG